MPVSSISSPIGAAPTSWSQSGSALRRPAATTTRSHERFAAVGQAYAGDVGTDRHRPRPPRRRRRRRCGTRPVLRPGRRGAAPTRTSCAGRPASPGRRHRLAFEVRHRRPAGRRRSASPSRPRRGVLRDVGVIRLQHARRAGPGRRGCGAPAARRGGPSRTPRRRTAASACRRARTPSPGGPRGPAPGPRRARPPRRRPPPRPPGETTDSTPPCGCAAGLSRCATARQDGSRPRRTPSDSTRVPVARISTRGSRVLAVSHAECESTSIPSSWRTRNGEDDRIRRAGPSRARSGHEQARRRRARHARAEGPQRRAGEEVGRAHHHQRRRVDRQGDRPRGPVREDRRRAGQGGRQEDRRRRR